MYSITQVRLTTRKFNLKIGRNLIGGLQVNSHEKAIYQWVNEVRSLWDKYGAEMRTRTSDQEVQSFVDSLNQLIINLEDVNTKKDGARSDHLDELAQIVYEKWCELDKVRSDQSVTLNPVPIGGHTLPPLPYPYNALEPYIDREIMRLHHDKHHQSYVDGLNKAEIEMQKARKKSDYSLIKHWEREAAFNGAGHYLHTIFWKIMHPQGGGEPTGKLATQIKKDFGSIKKMKEHFSKAAENVEAVGWALLVWSPRSHRLEILQAEKHQNLSQQDVIPLLVLDVWEHAYYLQYKNERKPYIENWWNVVNWPEVEERFQQASVVRWEPF